MLGEGRTGISIADDFLPRILKTCIEFGVAPLSNINLHVTPIDYIARAIVWLSLRQDSLGKTYHLTNPDIVNLNSFINFARSIGYAIDQIDFEPWLEAFLGTPDTKSQQGLSPYLNFYTIDQIMSLRLILNLPIRISDRATQVALETSGIACTPLDKRAMEAYFTYFVKTGFFPLPRGKQ